MIELPMRMRSVRVAAAAKTVSASACVPPVVIQAAGTPACSAATICSTAAAAFDAWIKTPIVPRSCVLSAMAAP
jgi:hypothetical protein